MKKILKTLSVMMVMILISACSPKLDIADYSDLVKKDTVKQVKTQVATLNTGAKQVKEVENAIKLTAFDHYKYDDQQLRDGERQRGASDDDYWSSDKYAKIKALRKAVLSGVKGAVAALGYDSVSVDCDDSMIMLYMALVDAGYPRDQLYWNYYLVPPSSGALTGVYGTSMGGHAVLTVEVEGMRPISMEDVYPDYKSYNPDNITKRMWKYVYEIEDEGGYYCVGKHRMDYDIRDHWYFVDYDGYTGLMANEYDVASARATTKYLNYRKWYNTKFTR